MIIWTWKLGGIECDDPEKLRGLEKKNKSEKLSEGIGEMHILLKQSANQSVLVLAYKFQIAISVIFPAWHCLYIISGHTSFSTKERELRNRLALTTRNARTLHQTRTV
jgi:hypothetical protein